MSLLLDALKEAEARKREPTPTRAAEAPFETSGALALAEDVVPEPAAAPLLTAPPASPRTAASPAEVLLAARLARAAPATTLAPPNVIAPPAPPAPAAPAAPAATAVAEPSDPTGVARPAALPTGFALARRRGALPWLMGIAALLALLVGGAVLYDAFESRSPAAADAPLPDAVPAAALAAPVETLPSTTALTPPPVPARAPAPASTSEPRETALERRPQRVRNIAPARDDADAVPIADRIPEPRRESPDSNPRISISRESAPLESAWAAQQAGSLDRAQALYLRVLAGEPGQVDAQLGLAVIAHARGQDEAARRGYRQVLESVPEHPRAWAGLAELAGDGDASPIESRLRQLLANRPSAPLHFALGNVLARQERWADAQQAYFAAAMLAPDAADYAYNVAVALDRLGKAAAASPWYRRALDQADTGRAVRFDVTAARTRLEQLQAASP